MLLQAPSTVVQRDPLDVVAGVAAPGVAHASAVDQPPEPLGLAAGQVEHVLVAAVGAARRTAADARVLAWGAVGVELEPASDEGGEHKRDDEYRPRITNR